jgi:hypothetical protein
LLVGLDAVRGAQFSREPYEFIIGSQFLKPDAFDDLRNDFPDIRKPGYLTVDEVQLQGRFKTLFEELEGPELTEELSRKFGRDLHQFPGPPPS